jgi:hypothetical protein
MRVRECMESVENPASHAAPVLDVLDHHHLSSRSASGDAIHPAL